MSDAPLPTIMAALADVLPRMAEDEQDRMNWWPVARPEVSERLFLDRGGPSRPAFEFGDFLREYNDVLQPKISAVDAPFSEIRWAAERLERSLKRILETHDEVRLLQADATIPKYWYLLEDIYCDVLTQIQAWLERLLGLLDDPMPDLEAASVREESFRPVIFALKLARPPRMEELVEWVLPTASEVEVDLLGGKVRIRWGED